jgi:hypothetical protein
MWDLRAWNARASKAYCRRVRTLATIEATPEPAAPGVEPITVPVQVHNTSDIVQAYAVEPLGTLARYATAEPPVLRLYPGTSGEVQVTLVIPRSGEVPAGQYPFGVKVTPTETPSESVTQETTIEVLPFLDTTAELIPRTSRGRNGAIHDMAVDNRGNVPVRFVVSGADAGQALKFDVKPQSFEIGPGEARFAEVGVKPVQRFWRGPDRTHQFQVTVSPEDGAEVVLDGTHLQSARIPKWFWKLLLWLLLLLLLLLALWLLLLRPAIESAAENAVDEEVAAAQDAADEALEKADQADEAATAAQGAAGSAAESAEKAAEAAGTDAPKGKFVTVTTSERLETRLSEGATGADSFGLAEDETMTITDVVFENTQGDFGTAELRIDGSIALRVALENFRSLDYHFVTPLTVDSGGTVALRVTCRNPGRPLGVSPAPTSCLTSALISGKETRPS